MPDAMLVFHTSESEPEEEVIWKGWPPGMTPRIVTGSVAVLSQ